MQNSSGIRPFRDIILAVKNNPANLISKFHFAVRSPTMLQSRVDAVLAPRPGATKPSTATLNELIRDLANVKETDAAIRVWDILGGEVSSHCSRKGVGHFRRCSEALTQL